MIVIGVLDLLGGRAVHARGGRRDAYEPVRPGPYLPIAAGDAVALAETYRDRFAVSALYVADLDAITGGAPQHGLIERVIHTSAIPVWLDLGVSSIDRARAAAALGAARVVAGLETLTSWQLLGDIAAEIGGDHVAFSLDLRNGEPVARPGVAGPGQSASDLARRAADSGAGAIIVLDLGRVGTSAGLDEALVARVRNRVPEVTLVAGGGVRGPDDLKRLADCGCDAALVATALHEGRIDGSCPAKAGHYRNSERPMSA